MAVSPVTDEFAKRPVEAFGPENLLAQQRQAQRRFEISHRVAVGLAHLFGAREHDRRRRIGQHRKNLIHGITTAGRVFASRLGPKTP